MVVDSQLGPSDPNVGDAPAAQGFHAPVPLRIDPNESDLADEL